MVEKREGIAIQAGLDKSIELMFLAHENWKELKNAAWMHPVVKASFTDRLFDDIDAWTLYGIDINPTSIEILYRLYSDRRINWIVGGLSASENRLIYSNFGDFGVSPCWAVKMTLDELFDGLAINHCDVLMLDIEKSEYELFENYTWRVKPELMLVEIHELPNERERANVLIELIVNNGYEKKAMYENETLEAIDKITPENFHTYSSVNVIFTKK